MNIAWLTADMNCQAPTRISGSPTSWTQRGIRTFRGASGGIAAILATGPPGTRPGLVWTRDRDPSATAPPTAHRPTARPAAAATPAGGGGSGHRARGGRPRRPPLRIPLPGHQPHPPPALPATGHPPPPQPPANTCHPP